MAYKFGNLQASSINVYDPDTGLSVASKLTENTTVNLNNSMTASEIQALINQQPKDLNGYILTFQFADGEYTIDSSLDFYGFLNGFLIVQGNEGDNTLSTTKAVFLNGSSISGSPVLDFSWCTATIYTYYLKISCSDSSNAACIRYSTNSYQSPNYCYCLGSGKSNSTSYGIQIFRGAGHRIDNCYFSNMTEGVYISGGVGRISNCNTTGTLPTTGAKVINNGILGISSSPMIGSTDNIINNADCMLIENLTAAKTVNLDSSMSAADIQKIINSQPKNLNGQSLTFQFADGTYNLNARLIFQGFKNGLLFIRGNTADNTLSTTKAVFLNFSGSGSFIYIVDCDRPRVQYMKVQVADTTGIAGAIQITSSIMPIITACYVLGSGKSNTMANILILGSFANVTDTYLSNATYGIRCTQGKCYSSNNDDTGTAPTYGLYADGSSSIGKNSTQPAGSTANELAGTGGVIR
ncbi:MAG TPA: hypothetical protein PLA71_00450 [Saccharofermentans sp.]|nr:hypothetical protein [Saccharofermentans sp.]